MKLGKFELDNKIEKVREKLRIAQRFGFTQEAIYWIQELMELEKVQRKKEKEKNEAR